MLSIHRNSAESWRQCVERYASEYCLEEDALKSFDASVAAGEPEEDAAWAALYEWDLVDYTEAEAQ